MTGETVGVVVESNSKKIKHGENDTFASTEALDATMPNSILQSSESGVIGNRITSPSFVGLRPISAFIIDFSISSSELLSNG